MSFAGPSGNLSGVKAISFDLDDTLWDCAPAIAKAEQALFDWHTRVTPAITQQHTVESLREFRADFRNRNPALKGCVTAMRKEGLKSLLAAFDYPEQMADEGFTVFYTARSAVDLYPGAVQMLDILGKSFRLAAITNGNADLQTIGISRYFERIYAANLILLEKPAPDMFNLCLSEMGITPGSLVHVGDNPVTDIAAAGALGVHTVWFNQYNEVWPEHLNPPDFEAKALSDVVALLQR